MDQLVQVFGSLLILVAFAAVQRGALSAKSRSYLLLNLVGSTILAFLAAHEQMWGFLMLEFVWALVSGWGLFTWQGGGSAGGSSKPTADASASA